MTTEALLGGVAAFLSGFVSAVALRWWQYSRELWLKQIDAFCQAVDAACEAGAEYWLEDYSAERVGVDFKKMRTTREGAEAKIIGAMQKINGFWDLVQDRYIQSDYDAIDGFLLDLDRALTGGHFMEAGRRPSTDAVRELHEAASNLNVSVRRGAIRAITVGGFFCHMRERSRRWQSEAHGEPHARSKHNR